MLQVGATGIEEEEGGGGGGYGRSRDSTVGIATGYGLDDRRIGFRVPVEARFFSS
jgi:hypothetical protein